jgi:uncharacterized protein (TIGR03083 family)
MNDTYTVIGDVPALEKAEAAELATAMYDRLLSELSDLTETEWQAMTICEPWTVADVVRHMLGAARGHASLPQLARQALHGARHKREFDGNDMDAMNDLQVRDHIDLGPSDLMRELSSIAPRAVAKRMSRPRIVQRIRIPNAPGGSTAAGMPGSLTVGDLFRVILTRDVFLHRLDIARATGRDLDVDQTEARLIADVVVEWAHRHGQAFRLLLTGPAGGRYTTPDDGPELEFEALDFCWILSGRGQAHHRLLETRVLF